MAAPDAVAGKLKTGRHGRRRAAIFIFLVAWLHLFFKGSTLHDLLVKALVM